MLIIKTNEQNWSVNHVTSLRLRFWACCWLLGSECWSTSWNFLARAPIPPISWEPLFWPFQSLPVASPLVGSVIIKKKINKIVFYIFNFKCQTCKKVLSFWMVKSFLYLYLKDLTVSLLRRATLLRRFDSVIIQQLLKVTRVVHHHFSVVTV